MNQIQIFQIDTFTETLFHGNPAAVCPLDHWLSDATLQSIARENNLSETAFFISTNTGYHIRWFTPTQEVVLCGHATLASAFVIFTELDPGRQSVRFESKSGPLTVKRNGDLLEMDFPAYIMSQCQSPPSILLKGLKRTPLSVLTVQDDPNYCAVFSSEAEVRAINPDLKLLEELHPYGVIVTAPGINSDCVSRYFAPSYGISEDPVTGSIHCALIPYWGNRLNKSTIRAYQSSQRGGYLLCKYFGNRVMIGGYAVKYLSGNIYFQDNENV